MRAFVKMAPAAGNMATIDWPTPAAARAEAVVRIRRSGLCGTDVLVHDAVYTGRNRPVCTPLIVGHEACGEIVALGSDVERLRVGARVAIEAVAGCGDCFYRLRGRHNVCQDWGHNGLAKNGVVAGVGGPPYGALLSPPDR